MDEMYALKKRHILLRKIRLLTMIITYVAGSTLLTWMLLKIEELRMEIWPSYEMPYFPNMPSIGWIGVLFYAGLTALLFIEWDIIKNEQAKIEHEKKMGPLDE